MFLHVNYRDQMPIMRELYRLRDAGELTEAQAQWFRETKPDEELFDTWSDPHEINDIAQDEAYAKKLNELRGALDDWLDSFEDLNALPEQALMHKIWPNGTQPVTENPVIKKDGENVTITTATQGASIGYKIIDNGDTTQSWSVYTDPVPLRENQSIIAVAQRIGYTRSNEVTQ